MGIGPADLAQYKRSGWLYSLGYGAYARAGDKPDWTGALYALQNQLHLPLHVAGKTALHMSGYGHFIPMGKVQIFLFSEAKTQLPKWFQTHNWEVPIRFHRVALFQIRTLGLTQINLGNYTIQGSTPERAMMEVLELLPQEQSFEESALLMEKLNTLRPRLLQSLLENCRSIKVKRLFLYLAEKQKHPWLKRIEIRRIDLGRGKRAIIKGGRLDNKYLITVPPDLPTSNDGRSA